MKKNTLFSVLILNSILFSDCVSAVTESHTIELPFDHSKKVTYINDPVERIILKGSVHKGKTFNPTVLGGTNKFFNNTGYNYRIRSLKMDVITTQSQPNESTETDIAIAMLSPNELVNLSSGGEIISTHQYYVYGDSKPATLNHNIPSGGFEFKNEYIMSIGSVSGIFPLGKSAVEISNNRLKTSPYFPLVYEMILERSDLVKEPELKSYRSPYSDRSYVASAVRTIAPYTLFKNTSNKPVRVHGYGVFLSNLTSFQGSKHDIWIEIDGKIVSKREFPPHIPGKTSPTSPLFIASDIIVNPGQSITIKANVKVADSLVFDFAGFILADEGLATTEKINILNLDMNNDKTPEYIDFDDQGSIWVGLTVGKLSLQDTQDEWAYGLPKDIEFTKLHLDANLIPDILIKNSTGFCMHLVADMSVTDYILNYCSGPRESNEQTTIWGDYNGDDFPDLLIIDNDERIYYVRLGGIKGLGSKINWLSGFGNVDKIFSGDVNQDGKTDLATEWSNECHILLSLGDRFERYKCQEYKKLNEY